MDLTQEEQTALRRFYTGEPARNIRKDYPKIWRLVARFRALPVEVFKRELGRLQS